MSFSTFLAKLAERGFPKLEASAFRNEGRVLEQLSQKVLAEGKSLDVTTLSRAEMLEVRTAYRTILDAMRKDGRSVAEAQKAIRETMRESGFFGPIETAFDAEARFNTVVRRANEGSFEALAKPVDARAVRQEASAAPARGTTPPPRAASPAAPTAPSPAAARAAAEALEARRLTAIEELRDVVRQGNPAAIGQKFDSLRTFLTTNEPNLLVRDAAQGARARTPEDVMRELYAGRPVTRQELSNAKDSYVRGAQARVDNAPSAIPGLTASDVKRFEGTENLNSGQALARFSTEDEFRKWESYKAFMTREAREAAEGATAETARKIDLNIATAAGRLEAVYKTTGTVQVDSLFATLRQNMADPSQNLLVKSISDIGESGIVARPRSEFVAPKDILSAIQNRQPITEREMNTLENFFSLYDPSKAKGAPTAAANNMVQPMLAGGRPLQAAVVNAGRGLIEAATREGARTSVPASRRVLFETGEEIGRVRGFLAGVAENPLMRRTLVGGGLVVGLGLPVAATFTNTVDPRDYGQVGNFVFNAAHQDWLSASPIKDKPGTSESAHFMYQRLTLGKGMLNNEYFRDFTNDILGMDLAKELKDVPPADPKFKEVMYTLATKLALTPTYIGVNDSDKKGYNNDAMTAYRFAVARYIGMDESKIVSDPKAIAEFAKTEFVDAVATAMNQPSGLALRTKVLGEFYGTPSGSSELSDDELVKGFANHTPKSGEDPLLRLKVAHYLVKRGVMDAKYIPIEMTQELQNLLIQKAGEKQTRETELSAADANRGRVQSNINLAEQWAQNSVLRPIAPKVDEMTADDRLGVKGKASVIMQAFQGAVANGEIDADKLEKALKAAQLDEKAVTYFTGLARYPAPK